jgi:hypothetical protein
MGLDGRSGFQTVPCTRRVNDHREPTASDGESLSQGVRFGAATHCPNRIRIVFCLWKNNVAHLVRQFKVPTLAATRPGGG